MDAMEQLIKENPYITPQEAMEAGVSKFKFYRYIDNHEFEQIAHGIYAPKDEWLDPLFLLHKRCPAAVFSHDEAFYHYGLSDREPILHTLTVYTGYNTHRLKASGDCKIYTVKKEWLPIGKTIVKTVFGHDIPMYDPERTICDLIRNRNSMEIQEFNTVLKTYLSKPEKNLNRLMTYAETFRIKNVVRRYLEVLL